MTDIALQQVSRPGEPPSFDIALDGPDLATDDGLRTAVIVSLFSDARARDDDVIPDGTTERRGYWTDVFSLIAGDAFGGRLWLLAREKQTPDVLLRAEGYAREALQWMIDDGVARSVTVSAEIVRDGVLGLAIEIARANGSTAQYRFERFWSGV